MNWFERLVGFPETDPDHVREQLSLHGEVITSRINGRAMNCGRLEIPTLAELRSLVADGPQNTGNIRLREAFGDVRSMHRNPENTNALFQVASQFNLLEMVSPFVTPEQGVGRYEGDPTQGPACAIAAGAGTIYRNYFVPVDDQTGQTADKQVDCLAETGKLLGNDEDRLWKMKNGYMQPTSETALKEISERLRSSADLDVFRESLRIGVQSNTEVTDGNAGHCVTQAFCSALPLGSYTRHDKTLWAPFAELVLEACYESTICASILNFARTGSNKVFLTLVGGGAFGNDLAWIVRAIDRALSRYADHDLDIAVVSYRESNKLVKDLVAKY